MIDGLPGSKRAGQAAVKVSCGGNKRAGRFPGGMQKGGWTLNSKLTDAGMDELFRGILALDSLEECYNFFEDLCTINELRAMEQRFEVARMLDRGQIYSDIVRETGASTATISRVNKCLTYGTDGYRTVLDRLKEQEG